MTASEVAEPSEGADVHQIGQTAIRHSTAHVGEGVTVRGLLGPAG